MLAGASVDVFLLLNISCRYTRGGQRTDRPTCRSFNKRFGELPVSLIHIRICAEDFYEIAMGAEEFDGFGHFLILGMALTVDEEEIFPGLAFAGAGFDLG